MLTANKKNQLVANSNMYWSPEKEEIRKLLLQSHPSPKWVLTLGGMYLFDAKMFYRKYGYCHIVSLERDILIWQHQIKESAELYPGILPLRMEFSDFNKIAGNFPPFDIVYLDFNGIINPALEQNLEQFFPFLTPNSALGVTFVQAHDGVERISGSYCFETVCSRRYDFYKEHRMEVISQTIIALAKRSGRDLKEIDHREYRNAGDKTPMLFLLYRVIK